MIISVDGKIVDAKKASFPINNEAFLFGQAVFETVRTYQKRVFRLNDHLGRLLISTDVLGFKPKWSKKKIFDEVAKVLTKSKHADVKLRIILTKKHLVVMAEKLKEKPKDFYKKGVKVVSFPGKRNIPRAKVLADPFTYLAKRHAMESDAYESILVDAKTYVRECAYANIFWVVGDQIYTTDRDILFGITRETVIDQNPDVKFKGVKYKNLLSADEVFITQTTSGILPVVEIDGQKIGNGRPGKVTKKVIKAFEKLVWAK